jgi:hypothetical protein
MHASSDLRRDSAVTAACASKQCGDSLAFLNPTRLMSDEVTRWLGFRLS